MQVKNLDLDISVNQNHATAAPGSDIKTEHFHAGKAIAILEKTAPKAFAHLQRALASEPSQFVLSIPTHLIRRSAYANRSETSFDTEAFQELKLSIRSSGGNSQPIIIRPVTFSPLSASSDTNPGVDDPLYEIVAGHRRYQCCRELGLPAKALLAPSMSDAELIVVMHNENHAREPLTPWEYGEMIKGCLDQGVYASIRAMARSIGRDAADLSRAYALTKLPNAILQAFETPMLLQYKDAEVINRALEANREAVLAAAQEMISGDKKLSRAEVLQKLTQAVTTGSGVGSTNTPRKMPLRVGTKDVGSIAWDANGQAVVRVTETMTAQAQDELHESLTKLLERITRSTPKHKSKVAKELT
jgi:ParB family chromosome partitioning protein